MEEEEIVFSDEEVSSDFSNFDQDNEGVTTQDVVIENLDGEEADDSAEEILRDDILSREGVQTPDDLILLEDEEVFDDYNTLPEEGEDLIPLEDFPKIPII